MKTSTMPCKVIRRSAKKSLDSLRSQQLSETSALKTSAMACHIKKMTEEFRECPKTPHKVQEQNEGREYNPTSETDSVAAKRLFTPSH